MARKPSKLGFWYGEPSRHLALTKQSAKASEIFFGWSSSRLISSELSLQNSSNTLNQQSVLRFVLLGTLSTTRVVMSAKPLCPSLPLFAGGSFSVPLFASAGSFCGSLSSPDGAKSKSKISLAAIATTNFASWSVVTSASL